MIGLRASPLYRRVATPGCRVTEGAEAPDTRVGWPDTVQGERLKEAALECER